MRSHITPVVGVKPKSEPMSAAERARKLRDKKRLCAESLGLDRAVKLYINSDKYAEAIKREVEQSGDLMDIYLSKLLDEALEKRYGH